MKIYDTTGAERDWSWLQATFGQGVQVTTRPNAAAPGYEIAELRAKEGPCTLVARVLDEHGAPAAGIDVARWWDDISLPPLPDHLAYWRARGVYGPTNSAGDVGFGMGAGDGYDPHWPLDGLPVSEIWARDNSDRIHGLGWIWATNHLHIDVTFRRVTGDEPPVEPPGDGDLKAELQAVIGHLQAIAEML